MAKYGYHHPNILNSKMYLIGNVMNMNNVSLTQSSIKERNKKRIIETLWRHSPISRTDLARFSGLNKATITNIINEIEADNMVVNVGRKKSKVGRAPELLMFNEKYGFSVAIIIRAGVINLAISDALVNILWEHDFLYDPREEPLTVLENAAKVLEEQINKFRGEYGSLLGIGIGTSSLLRRDDDLMYAVHSISWFDVPLGEFFRQKFKVPILVDTAANNAMLGEQYFGAARNVSNAVFLSVGKGIGGGLLLGDQIYRGKSGFAGDLGHFMIDPDGPPCPCGNVGCWEVMGSALAIQEGTLQEVVEKAEGGDSKSITLLNSMGHALGMGIANLVRVLNPELVILGGDIVAADKWIINPCNIELKTRLWPFVWKETNLCFAELGTRSSIVGALTRVVTRFFV